MQAVYFHFLLIQVWLLKGQNYLWTKETPHDSVVEWNLGRKDVKMKTDCDKKKPERYIF